MLERALLALLLAVLAALLPLPAQQKELPQQEGVPQEHEAVRALDAILEEADPTEARVESVARLLIAEKTRAKGLPALRLAFELEVEDTGTGRSRTLSRLLKTVALGWIEDVEKSKMIFVGQFDGLKPLMPHIGDFYLGLLLDTPQWFSIDHRHKVVPALRDLYPKGPGDRRLPRIIALVENVDVEPEALRQVLAYALAQWGERRFVKDRIQALEKRAAGEEEDEAVIALRELADIYYGIRDYMPASIAYQEFLRRAEASEAYRLPVDYYNAACCFALSGNPRVGMQFLERAARYNQSRQVDSSVRLKRSLLEKDPEIATLRAMEGFGALLDKWFAVDDALEPLPARDAGEKRR